MSREAANRDHPLPGEGGGGEGPPASSGPVFDAYADYYDLLYRDKDYSAEAAYVAGHIRRLAPTATRILELGCGTGGHAVHLAAEGFRIDGIDQSPAMLELARQRRLSLPPELAARLEFGEGDVRTLRTGRTYDVVMALFHVMSYQTATADLEAAFETAACHLAPGGLFLFDYWYGPAVLTERPEVRVRRLEDDAIRVTRIAEPVVHHERNVVDVNYAVFVEHKATGRIEELHETHPMRYLFLPEIPFLAGPRFAPAGHFAWLADSSPEQRSWGVMSVMTRV